MQGIPKINFENKLVETSILTFIVFTVIVLSSYLTLKYIKSLFFIKKMNGGMREAQNVMYEV